MQKIFTYILLLCFFTISAQEFKFPGEIIRNGQTVSGNFDKKINSRITGLQFQSSNTNEVIDLFQNPEITFSYPEDDKTYITQAIGNSILINEILVTGRVSLYKEISSENFIVENGSSGLRVLERFEDFTKTRNNARGILTVIFEDCAEVRGSLERNRFTYASIQRYVENYNKCQEFSNDYTFSNRQLENLEFSKKKGIVNIELGASILSQQIEFSVPDISNFDESISNFSLHANVNFSPSYFKQLRRKLFFDIGLAVNFQSSASNNSFDVEKNSVLVNISPRYSFLPDAKVNPFVRTNFALAIDTFNITENITGALDAFDGSIDETGLGFAFSVEAGVDISRFRLSVLFTPNYKTDLNSSEGNQLIITSQNIALKAAYILGKK